MNLHNIVEIELRNRLARADALLRQAKDCLEAGDYLQCATRIELAANEGKFNEFAMSVFDSMSDEARRPTSCASGSPK